MKTLGCGHLTKFDVLQWNLISVKYTWLNSVPWLSELNIWDDTLFTCWLLSSLFMTLDYNDYSIIVVLIIIHALNEQWSKVKKGE